MDTDSPDNRTHAIGEAVFLNTETPDYEEKAVSFETLDEMVELCSKSHPEMVLERVVVFGRSQGEPCSVTLSFVSASKGQRKSNFPLLK